MQSSERIRQYSHLVCDQIRWKKARTAVGEEISNHLVDQRNAYISGGLDEAAATDKAIIQMGDPVAVGAQLDRTHHPRPQWGMLALAVLLACSGALIQIFFELNSGGVMDSDTTHLLIYVPFALALMIIVYFLDFSIISRHPIWFYILPMAFLIVNFIIFSTTADFVFQGYCTLVLSLMPIGYVGFVYAMRNKGYWSLAACGAALLLPSAIMLNLSPPSEVLMFAVTSLAILCVAISRGWLGVNKRNAFLLILTPVAAALLFALVYILVSGQTWEQIMAALGSYYKGDISADIRTLLAHSRLIGPGSISETPFGPYDLDPLRGYNAFFVLTYLIFNIGWIPVILLLALLLMFIIMGFARCFRQKSILGLLVSLSVMLTLTMQSVSYVLPNLGVDLYLPWSMPFLLDFGYTSCVNMALVGLMLSVFRAGNLVRDGAISKRRLDMAGY